MDIDEACHKLRVTPNLLKWFTEHKVKGRKLGRKSDGSFDPDEIASFDKHLWDPWPNRSVPAGISRELRLETTGACPLCRHPMDKGQEAHIRRKRHPTTGEGEVDHYIQHPMNLLLVCGTCHDRYDDPKLQGLDYDVVLHAKSQVVERKMEAIDRDVRQAKATRSAIEEMKTKIMESSGGNPWTTQPQAMLATASAASGLRYDPSLPVSVALQGMSGSLASGLTQATLDGYAMEADGLDPGDPWDHLDQRPERCFCGEIKDTVNYTCLSCGHAGWCFEVPVSYEATDEGGPVPHYEDARGEYEPLRCEKCDSANLEVTFTEAFCSGCQHRFGSA